MPRLLVIMSFVFVAYLVIGIPMPVLPLYVHDELGLSNVMVGIVAGSPFAAALLSRIAAGRYTDRYGPKRAVFVGLVVASAGGVAYAASLPFGREPNVSAGVLVIGRALLGIADSFTITGALSWGLASIGTQRTGKTMSWIGTSIYVAYAAGAPIGAALYAAHGFFAIALATAIVPLGAIVLIVPLRDAQPAGYGAAPSRLQPVFAAVLQPGIGVALSGVGFGAIVGFVALLFAQHHWVPIWGAFSAMSLAFIAGRLGLGDLPDRFGGANVTLACVAIEAIGLTIIWLAPTMALALGGIALAALGYALVYPALGSEALRRAPPESRGLATGTYTAFLDLSLGVSGPLLGLIATHDGIASIYACSALFALGAGPTTWPLRKRLMA
jgi:MFS family permease